jgi:hypothetical protein
LGKIDTDRIGVGGRTTFRPLIKRLVNSRSCAVSRIARFSTDFFHIRTAVFPQFFGRSPFVLLTLLLLVSDTEYKMARYSAFLGRRVEVQYRAGDILLPASGTFVADSGRSIFLEQNFEQRGQHKHFRWEIPYQYLVRIEEKPDSGVSANGTCVTAASKAAPEAPVESKAAEKPLSAAATASAGGASGTLPLSHRA